MVHQKPSIGIRRWLGTQKFSNTSVIDSQELGTSCDGIAVIAIVAGILVVSQVALVLAVAVER